MKRTRKLLGVFIETSSWPIRGPVHFINFSDDRTS